MDLTTLFAPLTDWLATQGTWGYVILVGVGVALAYLKGKYYPTSTPSTVPSPTPNAATTPALLAGLAPLLHDALVALKLIPATGATINDVNHSTLVQIANDVASVTDAKTAAHSAALVDLQPTTVNTTQATAPVVPK